MAKGRPGLPRTRKGRGFWGVTTLGDLLRPSFAFAALRLAHELIDGRHDACGWGTPWDLMRQACYRAGR